MAFDAREALQAAEVEYPPFDFVGLDGETYRLPNPYMMSPAKLAKDLGLGPDDDIDTVPHREVLSKLVPEAWAAVEAMPALIQGQVIEEWAKACGLEDLLAKLTDDPSDDEGDPEGKAPSQSSAPAPT